MSDYTKSIIDLSSDAQSKISKAIDIYSKAYYKKFELQLCFDRHIQYFKDGRNLRITEESFHDSFKAKNFWKDVEDCGSWLEFRWYKSSDTTKLHTANFCKRDKICPACAVRRAYKQQNKFISILETEQDMIDKEWYYIVLPVKHNKSESFETVFDRVSSMRQKLVKSMRNKRTRFTARGSERAFWSIFDGGMYAVEVTYTKNGWNVHLNLLLNAPKGTQVPTATYKQSYRGKAKEWHMNSDLSDWLQSHVDDSYIHNIAKLDMSSEDLVKKNLVEILKYSLKFASLSEMQTIEVFVKTRKKRLFGAFGNLWGKGIKEDIELSGDIIKDEDFIELIFTRALGEFDEPIYSLYKREEKFFQEDVTPEQTIKSIIEQNKTKDLP